VLGASRSDHVFFPVVRPWLERLWTEREPFAVPDAVWVAVVSIATNPRVFPVPTPREDVFAFLRSVRARPGHVPVRAGRRHFQHFERACDGGDATGDLVPDAHLAALAIEHGAELVSFDRDFARFPGLRWTRPA
jgi:toxin-antitoxin system PIN domain toxin